MLRQAQHERLNLTALRVGEGGTLYTQCCDEGLKSKMTKNFILYRLPLRRTIELAIIGLLLLFYGVLQADQDFPDTVAAVKKSIVAVGTMREKRSPRYLFLGTGFAVGDGSFITTNAHVLSAISDRENFEQLAVFVNINNEVGVIAAEKLVVDQTHDLAVLKISSKLPALSLSKENVREGQTYAFTGYPMGMVLGLYPVTHRGLVSAISPVVIPALNAKYLNAKMIKSLRNPYNVFQLDATAYPGNSGSPLYNLQTGAVVGVINKVLVQETKENILSKPSGISYAVPIEHVRQLLESNE
jgi:S1-C subfamily serine protease